MAFMQWTEMLAIDDTVDEQHRGLIEAINNFHEAISGGQEPVAVASTLEVLIAYSMLHFAAEERMLALASYPHLEHHRLQHARFIDQLVSFDQQLDHGRSGLGHSMSRSLGSWLINHIMISDKTYARFLRDGSDSNNGSSDSRPAVSASAAQPA